jgi:hypothetical protein
MNIRKTTFAITSIAIVAALLLNDGVGDQPQDRAGRTEENSASVTKQRADFSQSEVEARGRARLLHEFVHGALQVMHRDFFREDEGLHIPSRSLDDVFKELHRSHGVKVRWLAVNAEPMNVDHRPGTEFETAAVQALAGGKTEYDAVVGDAFQFAGLIRLPSQCLKCHVPGRTSNHERAAAVVITLPLQTE